MWLAIVLMLVIVVLATRENARARATAVAIYSIYLAFAVLYIPIRKGFRLDFDCEWTFDLPLAVYSLGNYQHMVLCACFFLMTYAIIRKRSHPVLIAIVATVVLGFVAEIEEGAARFHHCRMRDLIPDTAGALIGALLVFVFRRVKPRNISSS
jgi:hypothetical protein